MSGVEIIWDQLDVRSFVLGDLGEIILICQNSINRSLNSDIIWVKFEGQKFCSHVSTSNKVKLSKNRQHQIIKKKCNQNQINQ